jgi:hypothetical protein
MSVHKLRVTPRDVCADDLGLVVGAAAPTPLAEIAVGSADRNIRLGVLGASHVVTVTNGDRHLTEQVSCDAVAAGGSKLPLVLEGDGYRFRSHTQVLLPEQFAAQANDLRERSAQSPHWICAEFPGGAGAITVLAAGEHEGPCYRWLSWHLYPDLKGGGTVVATESWWTAR